MFDDLWVIILAAGQSRRFLEEGYRLPKPLIRLRSKDGAECSMLSHVEDSLPVGFKNVVAVLNQNVFSPKDFVGQKFFIKETQGQADTAHQAMKAINEDQKVLLLDCDMILDAVDLLAIASSLNFYDVSVAVTETFDPNASRVDQVPYPSMFAEKEPISQWGIVSARGFKSSKGLEAVLNHALGKGGMDISLSNALNYYHGSKYAHVIKNYADLGTPQRIEQSGWKILDKKS